MAYVKLCIKHVQYVCGIFPVTHCLFKPDEANHVADATVFDFLGLPVPLGQVRKRKNGRQIYV